ncbi:XRE family transcriptional regulator [Brevibacterium daeguense]|nr:XRE family transcriptional regulator [Brevibacterium daeguense]
MTTDESLITPEQARAARTLVQISPEYLAGEIGVETSALRGFEYGLSDIDPAQNGRLREVLEAYGAVFIPEDDEGGCGVRLKFNRSKVRSLNRWENEGGPAYEDDV